MSEVGLSRGCTVPSASDNIGPFEIRGKLGQGAMAVVWRGYDPSLDREVAIKEPLLPATSNTGTRAEFSERFVREARAAARLSHPGIVTIYSAAVYDERPVIVMELVQGPTLREVLRDKPLSTRQTYALMDQLLGAVAYAHDNGVTHRDLKPDNVFIAKGGVVKLTDFGIAQIGPKGTVSIYDTGLAHADMPALTRVGSMLGTPAYMAPEQVRGEQVDASCDVFALGIVAYECLSGANPFGNESSTHFATILHRIMSEPTPPLVIDDEVGGPLAGVIMRALEKDREKRFTNAAEMLQAWRRAFSATIDTKAELAALGGVGGTGGTVVPGITEKTQMWGAVAGAAASGSPEIDRASDTSVSSEPVSERIVDAPVAAEGLEQPIAAVADEVPLGSADPETPSESGAGRSRRPLIVAAAVIAVVLAGAALVSGREKSPAQSAPPVAAKTVSTESVEPTVEAEPENAPPQPMAVELKATSGQKSVKKGQKFTVSVKASAANGIADGTVLVLQRKYSGGEWKKLKAVKLQGQKASVKLTLGKNTSYRFVLEGTESLKASTSNKVNVKLKRVVVQKSPPAPKRKKGGGGVVVPPM